MSYKVLARKWRPQRFDDVIGQRAVTQTLRNAIGARRIAQSFVFAGPRGVGKTTTARILARGLNCETGPTADPCGTCDACIEIAEGRDMDVLEIDAATYTGIDRVREVIISGLGIAPVRDRYKVFIIDEVHRLSVQAFDALLKSIEEPPPHVVFMMATTEIEKVPPTIQSRSQMFELKTIGVKQIADQLRMIAAAEQIALDEPALMLIARAGDGSMRDAQSAFDQVIAFAGTTISAEDVSTVLGLVRRELLMEMADAVAREDGAAAFQLADRAIEAGYDPRIVVRELSRLTRDLLVIKIDPGRLNDPEIAAEGEREQLSALAKAFSPEDLMRAFEVLAKGEVDIRSAVQPRFHLEMTLMRWIHLRKLVPLSDLIEGLEKGGGRTPSGPARSSLPAPPSRPAAPGARPAQAAPAPAAPAPPARPGRTATRRARRARPQCRRRQRSGRWKPRHRCRRSIRSRPIALKDAFLEEIRKVKKFFYGTVIAQAQRIEIDGDRVVITFAPQHRALKLAARSEPPAARDDRHPAAGSQDVRRQRRRSGVGARRVRRPGLASREPNIEKQAALREQALADSGVQAMLDVFSAEIRDVEEM